MAYDRACPCGLRRCTALVAEPGPCNENVCAHPLVRDDLCYCRVIHRCEVHVHSIIMAVLLFHVHDDLRVAFTLDFTGFGMHLFTVLMVSMVFGVVVGIPGVSGVQRDWAHRAYTLIGAIIFTIYNVVACAVGVEGVASALLAQHLLVSDSVQCVTHSSVFDTMWNEEETSGWSRRLQGRRDVFFTSSSDAA